MDVEAVVGQNGCDADHEIGADVLSKITTQLQSGATAMPNSLVKNGHEQADKFCWPVVGYLETN
jgi:hypothetical protein